MEREFKYIFGPVPSRRLGISLGIDLLPSKICSLNCIYCECGPTMRLTNRRMEYVPTKAVIKELNSYLKTRPRLDYITFSGSGEPTLHNKIGDIIDYVKDRYPEYKLALLTNGTLFYRKEVRNAVLRCDTIIPSLDAGDNNIFIKINRPYKKLSFRKYIDGLISMRNEYNGLYILEIFIARGVNDSKQNFNQIVKIIKKIQPDNAQINTLDRPGAVNWVQPSPISKLKLLNSMLIQSGINSEIIARKRINKASHSQKGHNLTQDILNSIKRRPMTIEDICVAFGIRKVEANKYLYLLKTSGEIKIKKENGKDFFLPV